MEEEVDLVRVVSLETVLSTNERDSLSDEVRSKIDAAFSELNAKENEARTAKGRDDAVYKQHVFDLDGQVVDLVEKVESLKAELSEEKSRVEEYIVKYRDSVAAAAQLQINVSNLTGANSSMEVSLERLRSERDDLSALVQKRDEEIGKLNEDLKMLRDALSAAGLAKMEAMAKVDDLVAKEIELRYKTKEFEGERDWFISQTKLLNEELEKKSSEILSVRRESNSKYLHLQTDLSEKIEELRIAELSLSGLKSSVEEQEKHVESLMKKLQEGQEMEAKMEENYRQELRAQRKVAELYKDSSEESSKKLEELEDAVSNLQELLKGGTERYGELETRFHGTSKQFQDVISTRDEEINKLKAELVRANEVLESIQKHGMTDEMIHSLSPAAAAASSLLKGSHSITEIFSKYQEVWQELNEVKCENMKLNGYIREILQDIETRAPVLKKQREEYERGMETVEILSSQLEMTMEENQKSKSEFAVLKKNFGVLERENERLKGQMTDLARQVKCLLGEVARDEDVDEGIIHSAQGVISRNLVTFKNVEELHGQNLRLLAVVRELSEEKENKEKEEREGAIQVIRDSFLEAKKELEELRSLRMRQEGEIKKVIDERDELVKLLKDRGELLSGRGREKELELRLESLKNDYDKLKVEGEEYRVEKKENDRIMNEQMDKLRDDIMRMRTLNAKLTAQVEYNNERAKVYGANLATYKKTIATGEDRNKSLLTTCLKHEQSISTLKSELLESQSKLSRLEVNYASAVEERNLLVSAKARLIGEKELLEREKVSRVGMQESLDAIRESLRSSGESAQSRLENELEMFKSQVGVLRRKLESESERFKDGLVNWGAKEGELRGKIVILEGEIEKLNGQIENFKGENNRLKGELSVVNVRDIGIDSTDSSSELMRVRIEMICLKSELESVKDQLELSRSGVKEYKDLAAALEERAHFNSESALAVKRELEDLLSQRIEELEGVKKRLANIEKNYFDYKVEREGVIEEMRFRSEKVNDELIKIKKELAEGVALAELRNLELTKLKSDIEEFTFRESQLKAELEAEVNRGREEVKKNLLLEKDIKEVRLELKLVREEGEVVKGGYLKEKGDLIEKEQKLNNEIALLKEEIQEVKGLNSNLQEQVLKGLQDGQISQGATGGEGTQGDSEQWLQLIRYLRREKELCRGKMEMSEAIVERLSSQLKQMEKNYEQVKVELANAQEHTDVSLITSSKQAELLRKLETLSALTDSNRLLRESKEIVSLELANAQKELTILSSRLLPLESRKEELEMLNESLSSTNEVLSADVSRWRARASSLIEKTNKVNPEEMKRLEEEKEVLLKSYQSSEENVKKQGVEIGRLSAHLRLVQGQLGALQSSNQGLGSEKVKLGEEIKKVEEENVKLKGEIDKLRVEIGRKDKEFGERGDVIGQVDTLRNEVNRLEGALEEHRNTVKQVKSIARKYKKQYEDLQKDVGAEEGVAKNELEDLRRERAEFEAQSLSAAEELRTALTHAQDDKQRVETELEELRNRSAELGAAVDEGVTRVNALKSQYESKVRSLESRVEEDRLERECLDRELEMLRTRQSLLEKQLKLVKKEEESNLEEVVSKDLPCTSSSIKPLTASIRPMSQDYKIKGQMKSVVSVQAMVQQQMQQQQVVQPIIVGVAPVSQAQVSTSTPDYQQQLIHTLRGPGGEEVTNNSNSSGGGGVVVSQGGSGGSSGGGVEVEVEEVGGHGEGGGGDEEVVNAGDLVSSSENRERENSNTAGGSGGGGGGPGGVGVVVGSRVEGSAANVISGSGSGGGGGSGSGSGGSGGGGGARGEVPSCSTNKRTREGRRVAQGHDDGDLLEEGVVTGEAETSMDEEEECSFKKRRTEEQLEEGQNEAEALEQEEEEEDEEGNEADQREEPEDEEEEDVIVIGSDEEEEEGLEPEEEEEEDDMLVEEDEEGGPDTLPDQQATIGREAESSRVERMVHNPRPVTLPNNSPAPTRRNEYMSLEDEGIVPSTPTLFVSRRSDGFAEALNSPLPVQSELGDEGAQEGARFTFSGGEGLNVDNSGRSVPSTPRILISPAAPTDQQTGDVKSEQQPSSSSVRQEGEEEEEGEESEEGYEELREEVPTSSGDDSSSRAEQPQHRVRPTPIVWDQPTSSTSSGRIPRAGLLPRGGGIPRGIPRGASPRGVVPGYNRQLIHQYYNPSSSTTSSPRGAQSARRSRPHNYSYAPGGGGGGVGGGAGRGENQPSNNVTPNIPAPGGRGFTKPY